MTPHDAIENSIGMSHQVLTGYLSDLEDSDLMVRPVADTNHIAWQLGHLIASEHHMLTEAGFAMPDLPPGFAEFHTPETSKSDDPAKFHGKGQYLELMQQQRAATLAALGQVTAGDLDKPAPESMREYAPTVGAVFNMIGLHVLMHVGQFVAVRRKQGKPIVI